MDRYGAPRPYVTGPATVSATGPGVLVGDTTFDLATTGGAGAVWLRSSVGNVGWAVVHVSHAMLGQGQAEVAITDKHKDSVNLEEEIFVRSPSTGEVCLCGPSGGVNLGSDWPTVQAAYAAAGLQIPLVESAELQQRSKDRVH